MKKYALFVLLLIAAALPVGAQEKIGLGKDVEVQALAAGIWRHVTYKEMAGWGRVPANGLVVLDKGKAVMIDTPWTPAQTALLLDWLENHLKAKVGMAIVGHAHEDCLGGLPEIHRRGIPSIGSEKTRALALAAGVEAPRQTFAGEYPLRVGGRELVLFYPGAGHTRDNIVAWIPDQKVLFGGCLVKAADAGNLGNTAEADLAAWPATLARVKDRFPAIRLVVPGHGDPGGPELIEHTLELLKGK